MNTSTPTAINEQPATLTLGGATLHELHDELISVYLADQRPWVIGYSGGKDSTAVLRLVYEALLSLPIERRTKPVFVVSSDTLVETPIVVGLIGETLAKVQAAALRDRLPFTAAQVTPKVTETFWVNLIGKGYPAPTKQFRWCTERMKIDPVSEFIKSKVAAFGEVIVVLGSRSAESATRAQVIKKHKIDGMRVARHTTLLNAYVYTPIESWSADEVWEYLFTGPAPWGGDHQALFDLYKDSNAGECPLVIDKGTPSCGNSRFGCWVCTVVSQDRAMDGLVESGHTWLIPLKDFRNKLFETTLPQNKSKYRSDKRRDGRVMVVVNDEGVEKHVLGPYRMEVRQEFLRSLLEAQKAIVAAKSDADTELITRQELEEIRRQWRLDPNEPDWADSVPRIYLEVMGQALEWERNDDAFFGPRELTLLASISDSHGVPTGLCMKLLEVEMSMEGLARRSEVFQRIGEILRRDWDEAGEAIVRKGGRASRLQDRDEEEQRLMRAYSDLERLV
jgi:DNA sulfur modification protein DndC